VTGHSHGGSSRLIVGVGAISIARWHDGFHGNA
jgi:hypothetical protein